MDNDDDDNNNDDDDNNNDDDDNIDAAVTITTTLLGCFGVSAPPRPPSKSAFCFSLPETASQQ